MNNQKVNLNRKDNVKVTVIMPIYNTEKFLKQSLESVLNQTLKNLEIICINDGSTDDCLDILKFYQKQDSRIKIIDKQNTGYGDSVNIGISQANGEYIGIVEPDDYVELRMFEILYKTAKRKDCDIVKSNYFEFDEKQEKFIQVCPTVNMYDKILNSEDDRIFQAVMNTWTGIYRKSFLLQNNIWHNITPGASFQDTGFWFQTMAMAKRVSFVNKAFYHHRMDNPNSSINNTKKVYCVCDEFKFIEEKLKKENLFNKFEQVFLLEKFNCYIYSFFRIATNYKEKFLQDIHKEFININLNFAKKYFTEKKYTEFVKFFKNTTEFYNEYEEKTFQDYVNKILSLEGKNRIARLILRLKRNGIKNNIIMKKSEKNNENTICIIR